MEHGGIHLFLPFLEWLARYCVFLSHVKKKERENATSLAETVFVC